MANSRTPASPPEGPVELLRAILPAHLLRADTVLAVAYSGGLDSTVLLHAAKQVCTDRGNPLIAFHINHQLSPHAAGWASFCQHTCDQLGVPLVIQKVTVESRGSIESAAREVRYAALAELCKAHQAAAILTAHHANDQAETVLFNLLRGTGLAGLRGISSSLHLLGVTMLRPLLELDRAALYNYADACGLQWIEDESNQDVRFTRNALRHQVLPALVSINSHTIAGIATAARHAAGAADLLEQLAAIDLGETSPGAGLPLQVMRALSPARRTNLLRYWMRVNQYGVPNEAAIEEWSTQIGTGSVDLTLSHAGRSFGVCGGRLVPVAGATRAEVPVAPVSISWNGQSTIEVQSWRGSIHVLASTEPGFPAERLRGPTVQLRARTGGERMQVRHDAPSRSLKNLYQEAGIKASERNWMPLVYCGEDLVFAAGLGMNLRQCRAGPGSVLLNWNAHG